MLAEDEARLGAGKLLHQGRLKHPAVQNGFEGHWRGYRVTRSNLDEVLAEDEAPLSARKLLHQGRSKYPIVQNELEGLRQGY